MLELSKKIPSQYINRYKKALKPVIKNYLEVLK